MTDREARNLSGRKSEQVTDKDREGARERREREQGQKCDWKREGRHIPLKCPLRGRSLGEQAGVAQRLDRQAVTTLGQGPAPSAIPTSLSSLPRPDWLCPPSAHQSASLQWTNWSLATSPCQQPPTSNPHPTVWLSPNWFAPSEQPL